MTHTIAPGNIYQLIPDNLREEVFEPLAKSHAVKIERILSRGQSSPESGWHDQPQHEWVMILKGAATLCFKHGADMNLQTGDYVNIPAHTQHRVKWTAPDTETIWLAVHYQ